jgi:hypothetical protein
MDVILAKFALTTSRDKIGETVTMLDLQPTLMGTHITLRPLAVQDFNELFAVASDPLVWAQHPDPGRGTREGFPPFFDGALGSKGCLVAIDAAAEPGFPENARSFELFHARQLTVSGASGNPLSMVSDESNNDWEQTACNS